MRTGRTWSAAGVAALKLALLERKLEVQEEVAVSRPPQPVVGAGPDAFFLRSPDSKYQLKIQDYTQLDSRRFSKSEDVTLPDSFHFRRVRPIFEGTLAGGIELREQFAVLQDAYTNLGFAPEAQLQFGKFAYLNGNNDTTTTDSDVGDDKDSVARPFAHPFQETSIAALSGLGIGIATTHGRPQGAPSAIGAVTGQTLFQFQTGTTFQGERAPRPGSSRARGCSPARTHRGTACCPASRSISRPEAAACASTRTCSRGTSTSTARSTRRASPQEGAFLTRVQLAC